MNMHTKHAIAYNALPVKLYSIVQFKWVQWLHTCTSMEHAHVQCNILLAMHSHSVKGTL